jgi:predicted CXXCH cytochrome family protein
MRYGWLIFFLISFEVVFTAYSGVKEPHRFSENECRICHLDVQKNPSALKPMLNATCENCHADSRQLISHPIDIPPGISVPPDMPLEDGNIGCITCHYVHPFSIQDKHLGYFLLRRPGRGAVFCSACHGNGTKEHVLFESVHPYPNQKISWETSLDTYTLQCIECHNDKIYVPQGALDREISGHRSSSVRKHPVGISFARIAARSPRRFNPASMLPQEVRLYNGKIGCGTCHSAYSKEKYMLVENNFKSRLCLTCHNK